MLVIFLIGQLYLCRCCHCFSVYKIILSKNCANQCSSAKILADVISVVSISKANAKYITISLIIAILNPSARFQSSCSAWYILCYIPAIFHNPPCPTFSLSFAFLSPLVKVYSYQGLRSLIWFLTFLLFLYLLMSRSPQNPKLPLISFSFWPVSESECIYSWSFKFCTGFAWFSSNYDY